MLGAAALASLANPALQNSCGPTMRRLHPADCPAQGKLFTLIAEFRASSEYSSLSDSTKRAYAAYLRMIEAEFGDMPIEALSDPEVRGEFKRWRDGMADTPRKADYAWTTLARVLSVAHDRGRIPVNPCQRGGRLYEADRSRKDMD